MNIRHVLPFCFILALKSQVTLQQRVFTETEGEDITITCRFSTAGDLFKFFCRGRCTRYLIRTDVSNAKNGRYSIRNEQGGFFSEGVFRVTIRQLRMSDTGRYWCGVDRIFRKDSAEEIRIKVLDAPTTIPRPPSVPTPDGTVSTTVTARPDGSVTVTVSSAASEPSSPSVQEENSSTDTAQGTIVYVTVGLVVMITMLTLAIVIYFRTQTKTIKPPEPSNSSIEPVYANVRKLEDGPANMTYSEVQFHKKTNAHPNPPPAESTDSTVYSAVKLD